MAGWRPCVNTAVLGMAISLGGKSPIQLWFQHDRHLKFTAVEPRVILGGDVDRREYRNYWDGLVKKRR